MCQAPRTALFVLVMVAAGSAAAAQTPALPRMPDGKPNLQGIWQVLTTASWDIQDHSARLGVPAGHMRRVYGVPVRRIRVIHRGVDLGKFDPARVSAERVIQLSTRWRLPDGAPVVMLPGRLTRWKGQSVFIDAIAKLGRDDLRCILVGSDQGRTGYRRELERQVARLGLGKVVQLVDHCDDMPAAYKLTDVVVSASTEPEAFGRVVAEGQALGRLVIATDHGGARETVIPGETGWLVEPGSADSLAEALSRCLALSAAARQAMAASAIANVRNNFSTEVMAGKTLDVYDEVLAPAARS